MKRVKLAIKKGSTVQVITGGDKGKKGAVLEVDPGKMKIRVQGIRMQTHYSKQDGMSTREGYLDYSNVKLLEAAKPEAKAPKKKAAKK